MRLRRLMRWPPLALCAVAFQSPADSLARRPGESASAFAGRLGPAGAELVHTAGEMRITSGSRGAIVAFYGHREQAAGGADPVDVVTGYAFVPAGAGRYRRLLVGRIGPEGGAPQVRAVFLASADDVAGPELVVLVRWPVRHHDVSGHAYGTFVYALPARRDPPEFIHLRDVSERVSGTCDCEWRDGRRTRSPYRTAAEVRRGLARLRAEPERARRP